MWDLIQQGQLWDQSTKINKLEQRVTELEKDLAITRQALDMVIEKLKERHGVDEQKVIAQ